MQPESVVGLDAPVAGWGVYILCCGDGTLYTGISNRMALRLRAHQAGKASRYTRVRLPVVLVYWESVLDKSSALKREHAIKVLSREAKLALITMPPPCLVAAQCAPVQPW